MCVFFYCFICFSLKFPLLPFISRCLKSLGNRNPSITFCFFLSSVSSRPSITNSEESLFPSTLKLHQHPLLFALPSALHLLLTRRLRSTNTKPVFVFLFWCHACLGFTMNAALVSPLTSSFLPLLLSLFLPPLLYRRRSER